MSLITVNKGTGTSTTHEIQISSRTPSTTEEPQGRVIRVMELLAMEDEEDMSELKATLESLSKRGWNLRNIKTTIHRVSYHYLTHNLRSVRGCKPTLEFSPLAGRGNRGTWSLKEDSERDKSNVPGLEGHKDC